MGRQKEAGGPSGCLVGGEEKGVAVLLEGRWTWQIRSVENIHKLKLGGFSGASIALWWSYLGGHSWLFLTVLMF